MQLGPPRRGNGSRGCRGRATTRGASVELRDYVKVMRARKWLIVLSVVAVTLLAVTLSLLQEPSYQGVAQVLVTQPNVGITMLGTPQPQTYGQPERDVQTQVGVIQSPRVAEQVREALGLKTPVAALLGRVTATADSGTNIVTVRAIDASAVDAARIANSFAEAYVVWSRDTQRTSIQAAADDVERRLIQTQKEIVAIDAKASGPVVSGADLVRLEAAQSLYATLADKLEQLRIAQQLATGTGSVLSSATIDPMSATLAVACPRRR